MKEPTKPLIFAGVFGYILLFSIIFSFGMPVLVRGISLVLRLMYLTIGIESPPPVWFVTVVGYFLVNFMVLSPIIAFVIYTKSCRGSQQKLAK